MNARFSPPQRARTSRLGRLWKSAAAAFAVALVVRLAAVLALGHYRNPTLWENGVIARYLLDGCGFCMDFSRPGEPSSWQTPAYPLLLAALWRLFGQGATAHLTISIIQACALASMVFPIRWLAQRWCGDRAGTVAMWLTTVMPLYVWYATRLHQAGFVMAAHPWLISCWLRLRDRGGLARGLLTGAASGLAGLLQPILLFLSAAIGAAALAAALVGRRRQGAMALLLAAVAAAAVLAPWTVRNYRVHGRFVPIRDSFGKEFWMGNNPHATGTGYAEGGSIEITQAHPPRALALKGHVPEIELMDAMLAEGLEYVRADPAAFATRTLRKIWWFWTMTPARLVRSSQGGEALTFRWLHLGYWIGFLAFSALALARGPRVPREYALILTLYLLTYSVVYGITHVGQARYRGEMEFVLLPLVAAGLVAAFRSFGSSALRPLQPRVDRGEDTLSGLSLPR